LVPPTLAAQQTATLQRFSEGRVLLNIVSGGDDLEQRRFGDWLSHDERYARTGEFLHIVNSIWRRDSLDFEGKHYTVKDARVSSPPNPLPQIYFGGSSPAALPIAAEYVDVYLTWGEPPQAAAAKIAQVRKLAEERGRKVRFGIRLHTISRDTSAAAWAVADELLAELSPEQIAKQTELHAKSESEGQRRMTALHGGRLDQLEIYPNLWAGVGLVRGGAGTALVGSHEEVANLVYEYHSVGFDEFILSGYPHLAEAYCRCSGRRALPDLGTEKGSTAVLLTDSGGRWNFLQTAERNDACIAESGCGLVGVVDAVQPDLVGAAPVVAEGECLTVGQRRTRAAAESAGIAVCR